MSERDTHFVGFAELLRRDLSEVIDEPLAASSTNFAEFDDQIVRLKQIITQRAYDLAVNIIQMTQAIICENNFPMTPSEIIKQMPDLTAWTEQPQEDGP